MCMIEIFASGVFDEVYGSSKGEDMYTTMRYQRYSQTIHDKSTTLDGGLPTNL